MCAKYLASIAACDCIQAMSKINIAKTPSDLDRRRQASAILAIEYLRTVRASIYPKFSAKPAHGDVPRSALVVAIKSLDAALAVAEGEYEILAVEACKTERLDNNSRRCTWFGCDTCCDE